MQLGHSLLACPFLAERHDAFEQWEGRIEKEEIERETKERHQSHSRHDSHMQITRFPPCIMCHLLRTDQELFKRKTHKRCVTVSRNMNRKNKNNAVNDFTRQ